MTKLHPRGIDATGLADGTYGFSVTGGKVTKLTPAGGTALLYDAKGDVLIGESNDTPGRLAVGLDGQVLTADSSQPLGVKWAPATAGTGGGGSAGRTLLQKITLAADASSVSLSGIPTGYEHLEMEILTRSTATSNTDPMFLTMNSDTNDANYFAKFFYGGSSTGYESYANRRLVYVGGSGTLAGSPTVARIRIPGYRETNFFKHATAEWSTLSSTTVGYRGLGTVLWRNTAAVAALALGLSSGLNMVAGTTVWLYGLA